MQTEGIRAPRRPGRPLRLPGDHSPLPGMRVASAPRIAWLVATSRILRGGPHLQRRDATAEAITGLGHKADVTRLSRWESGSQPVPPRILDAYERLLGLEPGHLTCTAAGLKRALDPSARRGKLLVHRAPQSHTELEEVCATIEAGDHTGLDWLRLAAGLEAGRKLSFADERVDFLTRALLPEVARAEQMAHTRRFEASRSLLTHSGCRPAMLRAIGSFVTAAGAQVVEPAVVLLQEVEDSQACALLLRMLSGRRGPLRRGAAWALAGKLNRNHVGADDLAALGRVVPELLARRPQQWFPAEVVDVLAAMDAPHQEKVLHQLRGNPLLPGLRQSLATGELVAAERSRPVAAGVAQRAEAGASMPVDGDEMLPRLVREALFHVHRERRHQAGILLGASPYAPHLAAAVGETIESADEITAAQSLTLLLYLAPAEELRDQLLSWGLRHPSRWLRCRALTALAYVDAPLEDDVQREVLETALHDRSRSIQAACLCLLGRHGSPLLADIAENGSDPQRRAARWWHQLGPALRDVS